MKKILLFLLISVSLIAYDKQSVMDAYNKLQETWTYTDTSGKEVKVKSLKWKCSGSDCSLIVNNKNLDPSIVLNGSPSPVETTKPVEEKVVAKGNESGILLGFTEEHNKHRRLKKLPDLVWDEDIAAYAQQWANNLKNNGCKMQHRTNRKYGENLAWAGGQVLKPASVVQMWADEEKDYDYSRNSCSAVCGHYTQVVWKNSKKVGCGYATCGKSEIWVCNYDPPGNYVGQKPY
jgi:uncharacterized protein YkwD